MPSARSAGSSPDAGRDGTARRGLEALDEAAHDPAAILECEPRVALAPLPVAGRTQVPANDAQCCDAPRVAVEATRRQQAMQEGEAQGRLDGRRPKVLLDAGQDALDGGHGARRPEVEQLVGQAFAPRQDREPLCQGGPGGAVARERASTFGIGAVGGHRARLRAADLVAARRAAEDLAERGVCVAVPDEFVDHDLPAAGRALRREQLVERLAKADLATRLRAERVDGGVEVAQVGRPEHDLGDEARERRRLVDVGAAEA